MKGANAKINEEPPQELSAVKLSLLHVVLVLIYLSNAREIAAQCRALMGIHRLNSPLIGRVRLLT